MKSEMVVSDVRRVLGYIRVSTDDQGKSGLGLDAQRAAIEAECQHRGWELVTVYRDVASGKSTNGRHQLQRALTDLGARRADALVVAKLDRLSRSTVDFGRVLKIAKRHGWPLVIIEPDIDTSTLTGKLMADVLISVAEWERGAIAERTKAAMAIAKKRRAAEGKAPFGRQKSIDAKVEQRIVRMRKRGNSFQTIAAQLDSDGIKAPLGGPWSWQTISRVVRRHNDEPIRRRVRSARLD